MLQQNHPDDFVISTGRMESVRKFIELACKKLGWYNKKLKKSIIWEGKGTEEVGKRADNNEVVIKIDPRYFRPAEVDQLMGDSLKAKKKLGWIPKITLEEMIEEMIENDIKESQKKVILENKGYEISKSIDY